MEIELQSAKILYFEPKSENSVGKVILETAVSFTHDEFVKTLASARVAQAEAEVKST